ncbi:uncharacterized protein [Miscanthus floridulus]|uniref:uncharacterized protein isoform X2 n=1 Tax=Miscanthus floridulus TaxID=154761 RepID=UPI00345A9623
MRGLGGPLLTIGDLLSDLAVDGGDDPLVGVGDASAPSSPSAAQQAGKADPSNLSRLFEEHYNNLMKALEEKDPSWPSLMLKLCAALKTADKLVSCANTNAEQLLEKVKALEDVLERGFHAVAEIVEALQRSGLAKDRQALQSKNGGFTYGNAPYRASGRTGGLRTRPRRPRPFALLVGRTPSLPAPREVSLRR